MIKWTHSFPYLALGDVAAHVTRLAKRVPEFILLPDQSVQGAWLHGSELRPRRELPFGLNGFNASAAGPNCLDALVSKLDAIALDFGCRYTFESAFAATARRDSGRWSVGYANPFFDRVTGSAFLQIVIEELRWPLQLSSETMSGVEHSDGGHVTSHLPRGVTCEIPDGRSGALGHLRGLLQRFSNEGIALGWWAQPRKDSSPEEVENVYAELIAAEVPTTSVESKYEFVLGDLESVAGLRKLCVQAKDEIKLKLGFMSVAEGLRAELRAEITKESDKLTLVLEDKQEIFTRAKMRALGREFEEAMGLASAPS